MAHRLRIKKGDTVYVRSGESKGKRGKVIEVLPAKRRVVIDGLNVVKRHTKPTRDMPQGGILDRPAPMAVDKVMLVCPSCDKPSRFGMDRTAAGDPIRVCKQCEKVID